MKSGKLRSRDNIDLNDPESYHTIQYNVTLTYEKISFNYSGGSISGVSGGAPGYTSIPHVVDNNLVVILKIPGKRAVQSA